MAHYNRNPWVDKYAVKWNYFNGFWEIIVNGQPSMKAGSTFDKKENAVDKAAMRARRNKPAKLKVHNKNGSKSETRKYD